MLVYSDVLDGIEYEIHIVPMTDKGWLIEDRGKFYAKCPGYELKLFSTAKDCLAGVQAWIKIELAKTPNTIEDLVVELGGLLVWEGYEDCNLDPKRATKLIQNFLNKHYERKG